MASLCDDQGRTTATEFSYQPALRWNETASPTALNSSETMTEQPRRTDGRSEHFPTLAINSLAELRNRLHRRKESSDLDRIIAKHVHDIRARKVYLVELCRALMAYGAPTHRIGAYMGMSARLIEIEAHFLYLPGFMLIAFDDPDTHTTEMKLLRVAQGVDLGKMRDVHRVYKEVSHDIIDVDEGIRRLDTINQKPDRWPTSMRVVAYGLGSAAVARWAYNASFHDMPICFLLGIIPGLLQAVVAPRCDLISSLLEIIATSMISFLARALGSIPDPLDPSQHLFCFSALVQSPISFILPGFTILSAALELQSRQLLAGSVRLVFAMIYSLWIGFGLIIGSTVYGMMDKNANSSATCVDPPSDPHVITLACVVIATLCLAVIGQAKRSQMPLMLFISMVAFEAYYWFWERIAHNNLVLSTFSAATISLIANFLSRLGPRIMGSVNRPYNWAKAKHIFKLFSCAPDRDPAKTQSHSRKWRIVESISSLLSRRSRLVYRRKTDEEALSTGTDAFGENDLSRVSTAVELSDIGRSGDQAGQAGVREDVSAATSRSARLEMERHPQQVDYILAAAAMLPAIWLLAPSGISLTSSLISGIAVANQLTGNEASTGGQSQHTQFSAGVLSNISVTVVILVIQLSIGVALGLFVGSFIAYPRGKGGVIGGSRRSHNGLFAF